MIKKILKIQVSIPLMFVLFMSLAPSLWADGPVMPGQSAPAPGQVATGGAPAAAPAPAPGGQFGMLAPMLIMFAVVYFLMIRPQQKKVKEQAKMLTALSNGDEVVTSSGILGRIAGMTEKVVTLEIADNVKIKILKSQVSQVVKGPIKDLA